mgnify:CR=1 FL=1
MTNLAIDISDTSSNGCSDTFVYVSDTMGYSLLVLDLKRNKSWKITKNSMYPYPPHGMFNTNGIEFELMDGILGKDRKKMEKKKKFVFVLIYFF